MNLHVPVPGLSFAAKAAALIEADAYYCFFVLSGRILHTYLAFDLMKVAGNKVEICKERKNNNFGQTCFDLNLLRTALGSDPASIKNMI